MKVVLLTLIFLIEIFHVSADSCHQLSICDSRPSEPQDPQTPVKRGKMGARGPKGEKGERGSDVGDMLSNKMGEIEMRMRLLEGDNTKLRETIGEMNRTASKQEENINKLQNLIVQLNDQVASSVLSQERKAKHIKKLWTSNRMRFLQFP